MHILLRWLIIHSLSFLWRKEATNTWGCRYTYTLMCILTCTLTHLHNHAHTHTPCTQSLVHTYSTHIYTHSCAHIPKNCTHTHMCAHAYTFTHRYTFMNMHTHTQASVLHKWTTFIESTQQHHELDLINFIVHMRNSKLRKVKELVQNHAVSKWETHSKVCTAICRIRNKPNHCVYDFLRFSLIIP